MRVCIAKSHTCGHTTQFYRAGYIYYTFLFVFIFHQWPSRSMNQSNTMGGYFGLTAISANHVVLVRVV